MNTQSWGNNSENNKYKIKRKKNEVENTANKKSKLKAENKSSNCSNSEREGSRKTVYATVPSASAESSKKVIKKRTKSHEKKCTPSSKVQLPTSLSLDLQLSCNMPSLPDNLLSLPGFSNHMNHMTNLYSPNRISNPPDSINYLFPYSIEDMSALTFNLMAPVSTILMSIPPVRNDRNKQFSEVINFSGTMYNEDMVKDERQIECIICLENMDRGQKIVRLQCLCIYHKLCLDLWFKKNVWCPSHPPSY